MAEVEIRQPVALRTLHGIELAAVGTWDASTGTTTFTVEDLTDAVAALECPGVRNPVLKLGHNEPDSTGGVRWDGEPAVGWVANMRFDGAKLIGDFTGMPAWLADADENGLSVLAAAYPDRSIEIWRPFECQIGHLHPSVVTAVALLGVAPPGVGVLKSMQDVYAAFTVPGEVAVPAQARAAFGDEFLAKLNGGPSMVTTIRLAAAEPRDLSDTEKRSGVDFAALRKVWDDQLDELLGEWDTLGADQRAELSAQIEKAVDDNQPDDLGALYLTGTAGSAILLARMLTMAQAAADDMVTAAAAQGVTLDAVTVAEDDLREVADAVAWAMADGTASTGGRTAAQMLGTGDGAHIAAGVVAYLAGLTDRFLRDQLGGALSAGQQVGRRKALAQFSGDVEWYASEINDTNACAPCRSIDGHRFDTEDEAVAAYGSGKYTGCAAGARCRGQLIPILGSDRSAASAPISTTVRMTLGGPMGTKTGGVVKASVSVEDISRKYYETAGYSMWITEMQVDPLQLIAADDATGKYYRIPVELSGDQFTFGDPQEVAIQYADVTAAAKAGARWSDRAAAFAAAGKKEDGTDIVAKDVSPAGAAIRKAAEKTAANATVIETEVVTPAVEQTPDAGPAAGPTNPKEASVDAAKMREALGLAPEATDAEVAEAFSAQVAAASAPVSPPSADIDAMAALAGSGQAVLVDKGQLSALVEAARKGEIAYNQNRKNERDSFLGAAVREGRIPVASLAAYEKLWDNDPEGTRRTVSLLAKNIIPVAASGFAGLPEDQNEADSAYAAMYGKEA